MKDGLPALESDVEVSGTRAVGNDEIDEQVIRVRRARDAHNPRPESGTAGSSEAMLSPCTRSCSRLFFMPTHQEAGSTRSISGVAAMTVRPKKGRAGSTGAIGSLRCSRSLMPGVQACEECAVRRHGDTVASNGAWHETVARELLDPRGYRDADLTGRCGEVEAGEQRRHPYREGNKAYRPVSRRAECCRCEAQAGRAASVRMCERHSVPSRWPPPGG